LSVKTLIRFSGTNAPSKEGKRRKEEKFLRDSLSLTAKGGEEREQRNKKADSAGRKRKEEKEEKERFF